MKKNERDIKVIDLTEKMEMLTPEELFPLEEIGKLMKKHIEDKNYKLIELDYESKNYKKELENVYYEFRKSVSMDKEIKKYIKKICNINAIR